MKLFFVFLICLAAKTSNCFYDGMDDFGTPQDYLLVRKTDSGLVRGSKYVTEDGVEGYTFLSVPVAEPPTGRLRFKRPVLKKPWKGVLDTKEYTVSCFWNATHPVQPLELFTMSEDCIQLHIFTNKYCLMFGDCAVAFYIHGGNFNHGTPLVFKKDIIVDNYSNKSRNVIMITSSHRQASFGLLNLNYKLNLSADVNMGIHDVVHQMEWVQRNIKSFGGNPNRVTLVGHSGGGTAADLLTLSPKAVGLFQQAALLSMPGNSIHLIHDKNQKASRNTAKNTGCVDFDHTDPRWDDVNVVEDVLTCLRSKKPIEISSVQLDKELDGFIFQSASRDEQQGQYSLFPGTYNELSNKRKPVPVIMGSLIREFMHSWATVGGAFTVNYGPLYLWCRDVIMHQGYNATEANIDKCLGYYNGPTRSFDIYDDIELFLPGMHVAKSFLDKGAPVYMYKFMYNGIGGAYKKAPGAPDMTLEMTPSHSMELPYIIGERCGNFTIKDKQIQYLYSQIFVDFINRGTPATPEREWDLYTIKNKEYFEIDFPDPLLESPGMRWHYHEDMAHFWDVEFPETAGPKYPVTTEDQIIVTMLNLKEYLPEDGPKLDGTDTVEGWDYSLLFWIVFVLLIVVIVGILFNCLIQQRRKQKGYQSL